MVYGFSRDTLYLKINSRSFTKPYWFLLQDETQDFYKRQQLRELAMLNSTLREESPHPGSVSPFSNGGMKRAKTGQ
jgi:hypothetical protein